MSLPPRHQLSPLFLTHSCPHWMSGSRGATARFTAMNLSHWLLLPSVFFLRSCFYHQRRCPQPLPWYHLLMLLLSSLSALQRDVTYDPAHGFPLWENLHICRRYVCTQCGGPWGQRWGWAEYLFTYPMSVVSKQALGTTSLSHECLMHANLLLSSAFVFYWR